jgi:hypothetical protein
MPTSSLAPNSLRMYLQGPHFLCNCDPQLYAEVHPTVAGGVGEALDTE